MAEREYTDYDEWMASGGDLDFGQGVSPIQFTAPTAAPSESWGPNGPAPPGTQWMLNPTTGQFEAIPIGTVPPWGTIASQPGTPPPTASPTDNYPTTNYQPTGDFGGGGMGEYQGYGNWPSYQGLNFDPGPAFTYKDFVSPSAESMLQEPGFQFRMDQGRKALEASAAGKGVLRSGGTLKDILGYGQNFASQEYGNVWNRALTEYDTNRNNQFGIHQAQYGQRGDQYRFAEDANRFGYNAKQRQAELDAREMFDRWSKQGDWSRDLVGFGLD